jgi:hypothetical protein
MDQGHQQLDMTNQAVSARALSSEVCTNPREKFSHVLTQAQVLAMLESGFAVARHHLDQDQHQNDATQNTFEHLSQRIGESSVWTKEHPQFYACRNCVNTQRLCMGILQGRILVLPLRPLLRASESDLEAADEISMNGSIDDGDAAVRPTELGYWIPAKRNLTRAVPYRKLDIWTANC